MISKMTLKHLDKRDLIKILYVLAGELENLTRAQQADFTKLKQTRIKQLETEIACIKEIMG